MEAPSSERPQVTVPFVCPACAGANRVHLISLSRAGGIDCDACGRWLKATDIMRAIHSPRDAASAARETPAADAERKVRIATKGGSRPVDPTPRKDKIVWPPTAESRAAVKPLYRRK